MSARLQKIEQVCRKYQVKAFYVFGSRSAEMFHAINDDLYQLASSQSDLDIGVLTHSPFSTESKVSLSLELEELFNIPRVDLFILQEMDAFLAANIIRGERVYAENSYLADEYELFVLRRAGDLAELERQRMAMVLQET
jgi:predicted nucleotidyltransferase